MMRTMATTHGDVGMTWARVMRSKGHTRYARDGDKGRRGGNGGGGGGGGGAAAGGGAGAGDEQPGTFVQTVW